MLAPTYGPSELEPERLPSDSLHTLTGHEGPVLVVRFNTGGSYCLTGGKDRTVRLWNPTRGTHVKTYTGHGYDVRDIAVAVDNSKFVSCGGDRQIFLWDVASGSVIRKLRGHDAVINTLCYARPDDAVLVSGGYDRMVKMWDLRSRNIDALQAVQAAADSITTVVITDRAEIFASSVDGTVRRYDVRMGCCVIDSLGQSVSHMAMSHDQECILSMCTDGVMRLLDRGSGELLAEYEGHKHSEYRLECAFTPSDAYVVAASEDGYVYYWELVEAKVVKRFKAHTTVPCSVAMHPKGACLLSAATDGTVAVWT